MLQVQNEVSFTVRELILILIRRCMLCFPSEQFDSYPKANLSFSPFRIDVEQPDTSFLLGLSVLDSYKIAVHNAVKKSLREWTWLVNANTAYGKSPVTALGVCFRLFSKI